jgi:hypothetical protein
MSVTMYAARGALFDYVKQFNPAPKALRQPPYDRKNRFRKL